MSLLTDSVYVDTLLTLITVLVFIKLYFKWSFSYWNGKNVESFSPSFPFGNARDLILVKSSFGDVFKNFYNKAKIKGLKYFGFYFLAQPNFIVLDLELIKAILTKNFQQFHDRGFYSNEKIDPLSSHLLTESGLKWKHMRTKISPTFTSGKMKMMFETLLGCSKGLYCVLDEVAESGKPMDVKDVLGRFTTDVIGSCAFGIDCNSLKDPNSEFRKYGKKALGEGAWDQIVGVVSVLAPKVLKTFNISSTDADVTKFFMNMVKETIKYREENSVVRKDFMHLMIQLKNTGKVADDDKVGELISNESVSGVLTEEQIAAEAFLFFIAGFETSATTLTFCFYELASNADIQEKLRDEIKQVLANYEGNITYDAIMEMTYLDKCVNETLRKYPPIPTINRVCTDDYKIPNSNVIIDKNTTVTISVTGIHYDPEYYPDPEKFDPERFSSEGKSQRHSYSWLPFGEGPRNCIGMRFALMQVKVGLIVLLRNYKFLLNSKTRTPLTFDPLSFVTSAKDGIWLDVEKLNDT